AHAAAYRARRAREATVDSDGNRLEAAAAARAAIGDGAIARGGSVGRAEDVLVVDDGVELALGLGAVLDGAGLERLDPVLALLEGAVIVGKIAVDGARRVSAVEVAGVAPHGWIELDHVVHVADEDGLVRRHARVGGFRFDLEAGEVLGGDDVL